jgi:hypothetical protein
VVLVAETFPDPIQDAAVLIGESRAEGIQVYDTDFHHGSLFQCAPRRAPGKRRCPSVPGQLLAQSGGNLCHDLMVVTITRHGPSWHETPTGNDDLALGVWRAWRVTAAGVQIASG